MLTRNHEIRGGFIEGYAIEFGGRDVDGEVFSHDTELVYSEPPVRLLIVHQPVNQLAAVVGVPQLVENHHGLFVRLLLTDAIREHVTSGSQFCVVGEFETKGIQVVRAKIECIGLTDIPLV